MIMDVLFSEMKDEQYAGKTAKDMGAFYTDAQVADFLLWWAIRSPSDTVMDPSFGGGVFLRSACKRLNKLGGKASEQVYGSEIDRSVHSRISDKLSDEFGVGKTHFLLSDFFRIDPARLEKVDVVAGNPPFIRYQRFGGEDRRRALACAARQGVRLSELSSSWAPFLVHSAAILRAGGRMAMVVPMEIGHAAYARPLLQFLARSFGKVTFLTFRKRLFPDLSEDTLLLLADDNGSQCSAFLWRDLPHAGALAGIQQADRCQFAGTLRLDHEAISRGHERLVEYLIPKKARDLYRTLKSMPLTQRLGELADVGIGYVTGANDFFHLIPDRARELRIPESCLRPAVRRGRALSGLRFTREDWRRAAEIGEAGYLLAIGSGAKLPESVLQYLKKGEASGVSKTFKCRTRRPWYRVPHVYKPDAFLSYMSGETPRLVANEAEAVAPNSLHILRLHPHCRLPQNAIAALWQSSLTRLSAEIEGHALGGGMLKIEPTEAENVLLPTTRLTNVQLEHLAEELDSLIRSKGETAARALADAIVLRDGIGLSETDCSLLRNAAESLRNRRYSKGAA